MATMNLSAFANMLKVFYQDPVIDALNNKTTLYSLFPRKMDEVAGTNLRFTFPVKYQRNEGIKWMDSESETFPEARNQKWANPYATYKELYGSIEFSAKAAYASRNSKAAFREVTKSEIEDIVNTTRLEIEQMMEGDGSGHLTQFNHSTGTVSAGTAITVDSAAHLSPGMVVESFSAKSAGTQQSPLDTSGVNDYAVIDQVDVQNNTVTFTTNVAVTDNYFLFRKDSRGKAMMGLKGICDHVNGASTLYGVDRSSTNIFWRPYLNTAGAALSLSGLQGHIDNISKIGGGQTTMIVTSMEQRRKYMDLFVNARRYKPGDKLQNGMTGVAYQSGDREIDIVVSRYIRPDHMFLLDASQFHISTAGFSWITADDDDGDVIRLKPRQHIFEAQIYWWGQLICKTPNRQGLLTGLPT